jgi:iron complex transport system permease protein
MRRATVVSLALAGIAAVLVLVSLATGTASVPFADAMRAAVGLDTGTIADFIVGQVRAPRVFTAALVGALLAASGAVLQSVARNQLASPDLIGISSGAAAGAVFFIWLTGVTSSLAIAPSAIAGALLMSALIVVLGSKGRIEPMRMIIAGIGLGFVAVSATTYLLTKIPERLVPHAYAWTVGSTNARTWQHVLVGAISVAVIVPAVLALSRGIRTLEMGDDLAAGLGVRVARVRLVAVIVAACAAGMAAALVGPIAFIALVAPALARRVVKSGAYAVVPAMLMGVVLTLLADYAAREMFSPTQLPIGLFTALVGGPYLIYLLVRSRGAF